MDTMSANPDNPDNYVLARHGAKPGENDLESNVPGVSVAGLEGLKTSTANWLAVLEKAPPRTIFVLAGVSELDRTRSALSIVSSEIKNQLKTRSNSDIVLLDKAEIKRFSGSTPSEIKAISRAVQGVKDFCEAHNQEKVFIAFPLFMKELEVAGKWKNREDGKDTEYVKRLLEKNSNDEQKAMEEWIGTSGKGEKDLLGPLPEEVARDLLRGMKRLGKFTTKHFLGRPVFVGGFNHSWSLDAVAIFQANDGKVNLAGLKKVKDQMIGPAEMFSVTAEGDHAVFEYRNLKMNIPLDNNILVQEF